MKKFISSIIDIRSGEYKITFLLLANIYIILLTYYFLKPARDSLFLVKLGADQLPYVFILTAIIIVPITSFYSRASSSLKLNRLINYTLVLLIFCLFGLRYLMTMPYDWVPYLFYSWVSIYGTLVTAQFWVLANAVYTATQAKRLFALLGLGGIFGAWTGGEITSFVITVLHVSTENLLLICVGFLLVSIILTTLIWNIKKNEIGLHSIKGKKSVVQKESIFQMFKAIKSSKHLLLISGIISLTMIVASIVDFQFKAVSTESFTNVLTGEVDKSALTAFLGTFYGRLSLVSIILQIVFAQRFLKSLGVGGVILFLPIGLLLGSVAMFASVGLVTAILLRGTDGALKYSLDKTGRELLFLPISLDLKKRTKVFIDMFIDRLSRGLSGALLLLLISLFSYETNPNNAIRLMSLVVIVFILIWIVLAFMIRKEYISTFRNAIEKRQINLNEIRQHINEPTTIKSLIASFDRSNVREICYALEMLKDVNNELLVDPIKNLLNHNAEEVKLKALRLLIPIENNPILPEVILMIDDENSSISIEAMHYLLIHSKDDSHTIISYYLNHENVKYQITALSCIADYGDDALKSLVHEDHIVTLLNDTSSSRPEILRLIAKSLGTLNNREFRKYFKVLLSDSSSKVATEAIRSIGNLQDEDYINWLILKLERKKYRYDARLALAAFDDNIVSKLKESLNDANMVWEIRKQIPAVLGLIHTQSSVDVLIDALLDASPQMMYFIIKALNKCRNSCPEFNYQKTAITQVVINETNYYYTLSNILKLRERDSTPEGKLLIRALDEKLDEILERIFRLLGLLYPSKDIYSAYYSIVGKNPIQKASAVEFLDNLLHKKIKKYLFPILDQTTLKNLVIIGGNLFGKIHFTLEKSLIYLINCNDPWLKALAIYNSKDQDSIAVLSAIKKQAYVPEQIVRETVEYVVNRIEIK